MRVLSDPTSIKAEIETCPDPSIAHLLVHHLEFVSEDECEESLTVVVVEPGDTLQEADAALNHYLLVNDYSGRSHADSGFIPCFETLLEHPTFYEMFFVEGGGELGISVVIPKLPGVDRELLAMCARHATPARQQSS